MIQASKNSYPCRAFRLGIIDYEDALRLQNRLVQARGAGEVDDILLILQHPAVITIGNSGEEKNVLLPRSILQEKKIKVIFTDRGGDVTYHGPGQLVAYPILSLRSHRLGVSDYVWNLEEVAIRVLDHFGISGIRIAKLRGVWVGKEKICALGVHLSHWVSKHGLALNVNTDLDSFSFIHPCGIRDCRVTSMARLLGKSLPMEEIESFTLQAFKEVFHFDLEEEPRKALESYL